MMWELSGDITDAFTGLSLWKDCICITRLIQYQFQWLYYWEPLMANNDESDEKVVVCENIWK